MATIKEEEANESAVKASDSPKGLSGVCQGSVVPYAQGPFTKSPFTRLASVFRKVAKSVQSTFDHQKKVTLMMCGPTGLATPITASSTKTDSVTYRTSKLAPILSNSQITGIQVPSQMDVSKSILTADITLSEGIHQLDDKANVTTDSCEQSPLLTDQLGLSIVELDRPCLNALEDNGREQKESLEMSTFVQESAATCENSRTPPLTQTFLGREKQKTGFGRRVFKKPVLRSRTLALSNEFKEEADDAGAKDSKSNKKRAACWVKKAFRKTHNNNDSAGLMSALNAPDIKEVFSGPKEDSTLGVVTEENASDISPEGGASSTTTNIFDLRNLEPVDEDRLWDEGFTAGQIMVDLAQGKLDEARMQRLKAGFYALLDSVE